MRLIAAVVANAIALFATQIVPGIHFTGGLERLLLGGAILGLFNFFVRPIALFLSLPALILTLGLFYFVLNGLLLWGASLFIPGYRVDGILSGMLGSLVISIVNWALHALFGADNKNE